MNQVFIFSAKVGGRHVQEILEVHWKNQA